MFFRPYYIDDIWAILTQGCQGDMKLLKGENQCKLITVYFKKGDYIPRHITSILDILYIYYFLIYVYLFTLCASAQHCAAYIPISKNIHGHARAFFSCLVTIPQQHYTALSQVISQE